MLEDAIAFSEYGLGFDLRRLPAREFDAHMAILEGRMKEREQQQKESEREARKARRKR